MKLNQTIAREQEIKKSTNKATAEIYHLVQKPALFEGFYKSYKPLDDADKEVFPSEEQKVQFTVNDLIERFTKAVTEWFDITATKDWANCNAVADVKINGAVLISKAPVPFLLFLEKQLGDIKTFVSKLPVNDTSQTWTFDESAGFYKSADTKTHRNKKTQSPIVLFPATDKHPAQTQLITEDVLAGFWTKTEFSGAIPAADKAKLLERIEELTLAVLTAREEANLTDSPQVTVGKAVFGYIFQ